jgi:tetratricopeptide (TPR) repeat protein
MRKLYLILFATVFCFATSFDVAAQKKLGRYHKNLLYEADIYYAQGDYYYAAELYMQLTKVDPKNPEIVGRLGICYFHLPPYRSEAKRFLELAAKLDYTEAKFYLARERVSEYRFFDALALIADYEEDADRLKSNAEIEHLKLSAQRAIEMVQSPLPITIKNLGKTVNSKHHDYAPVCDFVNNTMYFTSRRKLNSQSSKDFSEQFDENIFVLNLASTEMQVDAAPAPLNTERNDAAVAVDPTGDELIIYRTSKDGYSGNLYSTKRTHYEWSEPDKLDNAINSKDQEASASFNGSNTDVLYFSSDREGGFGGKDIYVVEKLNNGKWGKPVNLGETINTPYNDDAPFVAANGDLYFASQGHSTMGGYDIFVSKSTADGRGTPENLGYPINTPGDDIFFNINEDSSKAYFSSERVGGFGLQDIYEIDYTEQNTIILKGQLTAESSIPESALITLMDEENGSIEGMFQTNSDDGEFVLALNTNKKYTMLVEVSGFESVEKSLYYGGELNGLDEVEEIVRLSKDLK